MNALPHGGDTASGLNRSIRGISVAFADYGRERSPTLSGGKFPDNRKTFGASTISLISRFALEIDRPEVSVLLICLIPQR